jgi:hypothetical protein
VDPAGRFASVGAARLTKAGAKGSVFAFAQHWHRVACVGASDKSIRAKIVMILFFADDLCLIYKLVHTAKAFRTWLQPLASYSPDKNLHSNNSFWGYLMKENLIYFQHFNQKPTQWEPKPSFEEASVNHNFVFLGGRALLSPPALTIDISLILSI